MTLIEKALNNIIKRLERIERTMGIVHVQGTSSGKEGNDDLKEELRYYDLRLKILNEAAEKATIKIIEEELKKND